MKDKTIIAIMAVVVVVFVTFLAMDTRIHKPKPPANNSAAQLESVVQVIWLDQPRLPLVVGSVTNFIQYGLAADNHVVWRSAQ